MQGSPDLLLSLLPFLLVMVICFLFAIPISRRKGKGLGYAVLCGLPFVGPFMLLYLVSLTDKSVSDRLEALEGKLP
jgi:hypothetical protein